MRALDKTAFTASGASILDSGSATTRLRLGRHHHYSGLGRGWSTAGAGAGANAALFKYTLAGAFSWARYFNGKPAGRRLLRRQVERQRRDSGRLESTIGQGRDGCKFDHAGTELWSRGFNFSNGGDDDVYSMGWMPPARSIRRFPYWNNNPGFYTSRAQLRHHGGTVFRAARCG